MVKSILFTTIIITFLLLNGCTKYPDLNDSEREKDITITYYDANAPFNSYGTYAIVDTVGLVESENDSLIITPSDFSTTIIDRINARMTAIGYQKVDTSASPDVLINAHVLTLEETYVGYTGGYWDMGYYYGYDPFYYGSPGYWGYGGYSYYYPYSYPYYYSSTFGAVLIEMIDSKNKNNTSEQIKIVWTGIVVGTDNATSNVSARITSGIDECFDQSPYL